MGITDEAQTLIRKMVDELGTVWLNNIHGWSTREFEFKDAQEAINEAQEAAGRNPRLVLRLLSGNHRAADGTVSGEVDFRYFQQNYGDHLTDAGYTDCDVPAIDLVSFDANEEIIDSLVGDYSHLDEAGYIEDGDLRMEVENDWLAEAINGYLIDDIELTDEAVADHWSWTMEEHERRTIYYAALESIQWMAEFDGESPVFSKEDEGKILEFVTAAVIRDMSIAGERLEEIPGYDYLDDEGTQTQLTLTDGTKLLLEDFQVLKSPWGDAPSADYLKAKGVDGWMPRGAGNADPYIWILRSVNGTFAVACIDSTVLAQEAQEAQG
ncbi:hypothetical protein SEA_TRAX_133 [Gordonia phage Trax]|uniref:Uncharacterized protein n=1 Tax=Gordonia phage Trax TaxID=2591121 RepID=A0A515MH58_9CAUD|nr:hypothetical protein L3Y20_gp099 [Gordonia phage Trax]QDM56013.1 hypothetical protein SEA_TRAX_133 [Gordonia phage Trax]